MPSVIPFSKRGRAGPMADAAKTEERNRLRRRLAGLLERTATGDRAAFRELYELSKRTVFGTLLFMLREREIAEDVAQTVYVSIWQRAGAYDPERGDPIAWMNAIARNRAVDRLRADRARGFVTTTAELPEPPDAPDPAAMTIDALAIRRQLDDLKPEYRRALILAYFNGYTHTELASVMGVPVGTAKTWVRRGLSALKDAMS